MKGTQCPCCKYTPLFKKDGTVYQKFKPFEEVGVTHIKEDYTSDYDFIATMCPMCGVLFREVKSDNNKYI